MDTLANLGRTKLGRQLIEKERLKQIEMAKERGEDPSRFDKELNVVEPGTPEFRNRIFCFQFAFFTVVALYCCALYYGLQLIKIIFGDKADIAFFVLAFVLAIPSILLCVLSWKGVVRLCGPKETQSTRMVEEEEANSV